MSVVNDPMTALRDSPFQPRLEALSRARQWYGWAGYAAASVLDTVEFEYFALRNQASVLDITPMHKYRLRGPDATRVLNRIMTRDVTRIRTGRVGYAVWCDEDGMVIDDGTLFRLGDEDWRLCCQEPMLTWLLDAAWGFDADITDESDTVAGLALQGPTSFAVLDAAGWDVSSLRPFDIADLGDVMISRTGFTGDLGYELWMTPDKALAVWDALWAGGQPWGLRAIGYAAVDIARVEAGFVTAGVDFQPVHATERLHRGKTPYELGLGRMVHLDKGHFNGRRALIGTKPRSLLMKMDVEGFKPAPNTLIYHNKTREAGQITSAAWSPTAKRNIALAHVNMPWAARRPTTLWAEIYTLEEGRWDKRMAHLTPVKTPFFQPPRARLTPPART